MKKLKNSSNGAQAPHAQKLAKTKGRIYFESIIADQQKKHDRVLKQKQKLQMNPEDVNMVKISISGTNELYMISNIINKSPYVPELVTDILHIHSSLIDRSYSANELLEILGYDPGHFQLITFIAHEGKRSGLPDEVVDEFKYHIYLMKY